MSDSPQRADPSSSLIHAQHNSIPQSLTALLATMHHFINALSHVEHESVSWVSLVVNPHVYLGMLRYIYTGEWDHDVYIAEELSFQEYSATWYVLRTNVCEVVKIECIPLTRAFSTCILPLNPHQSHRLHITQDMLRLCTRFFVPHPKQRELRRILLSGLPLRSMYRKYKERHSPLSSTHSKVLRDACTQLARFLLCSVPASPTHTDHILNAILDAPSHVQHELMMHMKEFQVEFGLQPKDEIPAAEAADDLFPSETLCASASPRSEYIHTQSTSHSREIVSIQAEKDLLEHRVGRLQSTIVRLRTINHELHQRNSDLADMLEQRFDYACCSSSMSATDHECSSPSHNDVHVFEERIMMHLKDNSENLHLRETIQKQDMTIRQLRRQLDNMRSVRKENAIYIEILTDQLKEKEGFEERCTALQGVNTELRSKLHHTTHELESLRAAHRSLNERFRTLMSQQIEMTRKLRHLKESLRALRADNIERTTQFDLLMKQHDSVISSLMKSQHHLELQTQKVSNLQEELIELRQQLYALNTTPCMPSSPRKEPELFSQDIVQVELESLSIENPEDTHWQYDDTDSDEEDCNLELEPPVPRPQPVEGGLGNKKAALWKEIDMILSTF